jgi:RNA polymerase sigma-70 factor, ECF subfamily
MVRMEESEADTLARARAGDPAAFQALMERHARPVFRLAYRMTGNEQDAEDVVQETFLKAFRNLGGFESRSHFGSWLYRIAANASFDLLRGRARHAEEPLEQEDGGAWDLPAENPGPERLMLSAEVEQRLARVLSRLTPTERSAFVLRHYQGLSVEEIATTLGCDRGATKSSIFRAVRKVREALLPLVEARA